MSWLSRLFKNKSDTVSSDLVKLAHTRGYTHDIVGEASYQSSLERIAGKKDTDSKNHECSAVLICENNNPHDPNAVAVLIDAQKVGYLSRDDAQSYRAELATILSGMPNAAVRAKIIGGWKNDDGEGHFGVKLNLKRPIVLAR